VRQEHSIAIQQLLRWKIYNGWTIILYLLRHWCLLWLRDILLQRSDGSACGRHTYKLLTITHNKHVELQSKYKYYQTTLLFNNLLHTTTASVFTMLIWYEWRLSTRSWHPSDQSNWFEPSLPEGYRHPRPSPPFIIITQPKSWHSLYRPTKGGRPSWSSKVVQPMPKTICGCQDKYYDPWWDLIPAVRHVTSRPLGPCNTNIHH